MNATVHLFPDRAPPAATPSTLPAVLTTAQQLAQRIAQARADGTHARGVLHLVDQAWGRAVDADGRSARWNARLEPLLESAALLAIAREDFAPAMAAAGIDLPTLSDDQIRAACQVVWPADDDEDPRPVKGAVAALRTAHADLAHFRFADAHRHMAIAAAFLAMALED